MNIITLDFETYYDNDYTLKKMTTEAYIRDPRFEVLFCGLCARETIRNGIVHLPAQQLCQAEPEYLADVLHDIDWDKCAVLCHHTHFDGLILSHHYGIKPAFWLDTLSMARMVHGNTIRLGLDSLASHYGLEAKKVPYDKFRGKHWADLTPEVQQELADGCLHDVELTWRLFQLLMKDFPASELPVIDLTVRMFTEPTLVGDADKYRALAKAEFDRKQALLKELGVTAEDLQSPARFVALLEAEGVEVPVKDGKNGPIPAIAKTDPFMMELENDLNPRVAALAEARLEVRSTIDETRAGRLGQMAGRGPLPVYLSYCGAQTTRWGGGDRVNLQNLRRGGDLRRAISAPDGYLLAVVDLSQIECRLVNWVAGQQDVVDRFSAGEDPYLAVASRFYGREITKADRLERGLGKVLELAPPYGMGWRKLQATCAAGPMGAPPIALTDEEAQRGVAAYRDTHPGVMRLWRYADGWLRLLLAPVPETVLKPYLKIVDNRIVGPNGAYMNYEVRWNGVTQPYERKTRSGWIKVWGGYLVENIIQFLARIVLSEAMLRIRAKGIKIATCTHDEVVCVVPERNATDDLREILIEMKHTPDWAPGLPLDAEGHLSKAYEK